MSVVRPKPPEDPIQYDPSAVFATGGLAKKDLDALADRLDQARRESLADIDRRLADIELHYTSRNSSLAKEIDSLR